MFLFSNINRGVEECRRTPGALLVDVREPDEFAAGHIPGAINAPLSALGETELPAGRPLFLYCLRGSRASRAADILRRRGCDRVRSIGGIVGYRGEREGKQAADR